MTVRRWKPCRELAPFVETFGVREAGFGGAALRLALPARRDCFLEFYFADRYRVANVSTGAVHVAPRCVLVGPHTERREDLILAGDLKVFTIRFSPVGLRALFGIPARLLRDLAVEAELVLGKDVAELEEQLHACGESAWGPVAEQFLLDRVRRNGVPDDGGLVRRIARELETSHGTVSVAAAAAKHTMSVRQMERAFQEHVGVSPKMFGRLLRLDHALEIAGAQAGCNWADVASVCGYFDQSHMVRDFRAMTGATPVEFAALRAGTVTPATP